MNDTHPFNAIRKVTLERDRSVRWQHRVRMEETMGLKFSIVFGRNQ
jgi:hypothetical protein